MYLYEQESIMDASTDPHVIRANPKYLYNIWTLVMVVAIKNIDPFTWNLNHQIFHNVLQKNLDLYL